MVIHTSYFYQVRFMKKWHVPISTARSDPKWFHAGRSQDFVFYDRRGVLNGLHCDKLVPSAWCNEECKAGQLCGVCKCYPDRCEFLRRYKYQLDRVEFKTLIDELQYGLACVKSGQNLRKEPEIILLVHETPTNECSERRVLQLWLQEHGFLCKEWEPS